jgi:signal transduction histidine kinase
LGSLALIITFNRLLRRRIINKERERTKDRELAQAKEIEIAYQELKLTQAQLIQSEKMASLGELTAGIAHEIQNPLNFVNNFSDVNTELIDEATEALNSGDKPEVKKLLSGIRDNEVKIRFHGHRADAIVKGMLQHARTSSGQKEPTDFNTLAEEYLRLSYQGLRSRDKSFNATIQSEFDPGIGQLQINPQDIGRVLLNLYNNAFYAVAEKKRQQGAGFVPLVTVSTRKTDQRVEIKILDNGNGIPQNLLSKIFQPFFTTKPTGQGTGLGLSLSYDIIKAHGGEIKVDSLEGEGTSFTVSLPA